MKIKFFIYALACITAITLSFSSCTKDELLDTQIPVENQLIEFEGALLPLDDDGNTIRTTDVVFYEIYKNLEFRDNTGEESNDLPPNYEAHEDLHEYEADNYGETPNANLDEPITTTEAHEDLHEYEADNYGEYNVNNIIVGNQITPVGNLDKQIIRVEAQGDLQEYEADNYGEYTDNGNLIGGLQFTPTAQLVFTNKRPINENIIQIDTEYSSQAIDWPSSPCAYGPCTDIINQIVTNYQAIANAECRTLWVCVLCCNAGSPVYATIVVRPDVYCPQLDVE